MPDGIKLGPNSPLLTPAGARRKLARSEAEDQKALVALLLGVLGKGERRALGKGMTTRHPELLLLYAINPNRGGQNSVAARGMAKAMGLLPDMMDLCLPVARGPFHSLYIEFKRDGGSSRPGQRLLAEQFRAEGHAVFECRGVEEALQVILGYLALPQYPISTTGVTGFPDTAEYRDSLVNAHSRAELWRAKATELLTPKRR